MSTYRELVNIVIDLVKGNSDDFSYTEDHILYLLDKYRIYLLKQKYNKNLFGINNSNYQTICVKMVQTKNECNDNCCCSTEDYWVSEKEVPTSTMMSFPKLVLNAFSYSFVSSERFNYVGNSRWFKEIVYWTIKEDNKLYLKTSKKDFNCPEYIKLTAIFESSTEAHEHRCKGETCDICELMDNKFPMEEELTVALIQAVVKDILGASYRPKDGINNAKDDLSDLANYISNALKKRYTDGVTSTGDND